MAAAQTPRIGCIILAAGAGKRFGGVKLLARVGGSPLLQRAIDAACSSAALTCTLVLGAHAASVFAGISARRSCVVVNREWRAGISSSLRCGLHAHRNDDACIVVLGDQPRVTAADLDALIRGWAALLPAVAATKRRRAPIVALRAGEIWGAPVLFPRSDFAPLSRLRGDRGAKKYALSQRERLRFVAAHDVRAFEDVDTVADLSRLAAR